MRPAKVRSSPTSRSIDEWVGKTPDSVPPPHVAQRIFDHWNGRCHITKREIRAGDAWHLEHIRSLRNGGLNRETNLAPALVEFHKAKTAGERTDGAKADRIKRKHLGLHKSKTPLRHPFLRKRMNGTVERRA